MPDGSGWARLAVGRQATRKGGKADGRTGHEGEDDGREKGEQCVLVVEEVEERRKQERTATHRRTGGWQAGNKEREREIVVVVVRRRPARLSWAGSATESPDGPNPKPRLEPGRSCALPRGVGRAVA
jgi:hypothetical protein